MATEAESKSFHVFISYRVNSDAELAEKICDKLQQHTVPNEPTLRVKCFLDKQDLRQGEEWEQGFLRGLRSSCLFVPIITKEAITPIANLPEKGLDNVLKEYELALELRASDDIQILPLLVGDSAGRSYKKFDSFGLPWPQHSSGSSSVPISKIMRQMFSIQGLFVDPGDLASKIDTVVSRLGSLVWPNFRHRWQGIKSLNEAREQWLGSTIGWTAKPEPERWIRLSVEDYENDRGSLDVTVGKVLADGQDYGKLFVTVRRWNFVAMFSPQDLEIVFAKWKNREQEGVVVSPRNSKEFVFHSMTLPRDRPEVPPAKIALSWIVSNECVEAVKVSITPSHSPDRAHEEVVYFDSRQMNMKTVMTVTDITLHERKPVGQYPLPAKVFTKGAFLGDGSPRHTAQTDFSTEYSGPTEFRVRQSKPISANPANRRTADLFDIPFSFINLTSAKLTVVAVRAMWRHRGVQDWAPVPESEIYPQTGEFPTTIEADGISNQTIRVALESSDRSQCSSLFNFSRSWLARLGPVQIKLMFEDKTGNITSQVFEFCNPEIPFSTPEEKDSLFLYCDDTLSWERHVLRCVETWDERRSKEEGEDAFDPSDTVFELSLPGRRYKLDILTLRHAVYQALSSGQSEVKWNSDTSSDGFSWTAYLLVDTKCQRVYAAKFVLKTLTCCAVGYYRLPVYGDVFETATATPATENQTADQMMNEFTPSEDRGDAGKGLPKLQVVQTVDAVLEPAPISSPSPSPSPANTHPRENAASGDTQALGAMQRALEAKLDMILERLAIVESAVTQSTPRSSRLAFARKKT